MEKQEEMLNIITCYKCKNCRFEFVKGSVDTNMKDDSGKQIPQLIFHDFYQNIYFKY